MVGLGGLEPPTPRLSSVCSNQLSYRPRLSGQRSAASCPHMRRGAGAPLPLTDLCQLTTDAAADRLWTLRRAGYRAVTDDAAYLIP